MRTRAILAAVLLCSGLAAAAVDPNGDTLAPGPDLTALSACQSATTLTIRLDFASPIVEPPSGDLNVVLGYVDIDLDRNVATGVSSELENVPGAAPGLGVELRLTLFAYDPEAGVAPMRIIDTGDEVPVPVVFDAQSVTFTVPLPLGDAPSGVNLGTVVGNAEDATDLAPNLGFLTTTSCCGDGQLQAGEDCDDDAGCCNDACLFDDGAQCGGDVCTQRGTCAAGSCGGGAPRDCDDGDPCFDDTCEAPAGCAHTDRTGLPGATCAFERTPPTACDGAAVSTSGLDKAGALVGRASSASAKKQKALLRKARKGLKKFARQVAKLGTKEKIPTDCAAGLQGQANDAIRRLELVLAGG